MQAYDFGPWKREAVHKRYPAIGLCEEKECVVLFGAPMDDGSSAAVEMAPSKSFRGVELAMIVDDPSP